MIFSVSLLNALKKSINQSTIFAFQDFVKCDAFFANIIIVPQWHTCCYISFGSKETANRCIKIVYACNMH